jgi:hypothetical protein
MRLKARCSGFKKRIAAVTNGVIVRVQVTIAFAIKALHKIQYPPPQQDLLSIRRILYRYRGLKPNLALFLNFSYNTYCIYCIQ